MSEYNLSPWMKKATPFVYLRLSSELQAKGDAGKPIEKQSWAIDQLASIEEYLKKNGLKMPKKIHVFRDLGTGADFDRPGLSQLLEAIHSHKGRSYIAISEPSRWGRNTVLGNELYAPLYRRDIPLLSTSDGLVSGTATEPRPNAQFLFTIKQGMGDTERGRLVERVKRKVATRKASGILSAAIGSLFPFARQDPLDVLRDNILLPQVPVKQGGGLNALMRLVESTSAPNGAPFAWGNNARKRENERVAKLTPEQYQQWYQYRKKIRAIFAKRDYDPARNVPIRSLKRTGTDFGAKALQRMAGGYLSQPFDPAYSMLNDEEIREILTNPKEYLSDADKKQYRKEVSKR